MKKIKLMKMIVLTLATILTFNTVEPLCNVYAESNDQGRKNLLVVSDDIENFIYTYTENDIEYMVKEKSTEDYKHIESKIYVKNESDDYKLTETRTFDMNDGYITNQITNVNTRKVEIKKDNISELIISEDSKPALTNAKSSGSTTGWKYSQTLKTSTKIKKYTLLAVTSIITSAVTYSFLGPVGTTAANTINTIAQAIISDNIPNVWIKHVYYLKFLSGTSLAVGEKKITTVYSNSARTKRIKSPVTTYYWN